MSDETRQRPLELALLRDSQILDRVVEIGTRFIHGEAQILSGDIVEEFYSGRPGLKRRTGRAANAWRATQDSSNTVAVFNDVPYADHREERVIKPVKAKALAIPIEDALPSRWSR